MTDRELMEQAIAELVADPDNGVTGAYIGRDQDVVECIVCQVGKKLTDNELFTQGVKPVPRKVAIAGHEARQFRTQVEVAPAVYRPMILNFNPAIPNWEPPAWNYDAYASGDLQSCQSPTIPGGSQIAPQGAGWVGTDGAAVRLTDADSYGLLTNWHVANGGQFGQDAPQCQPHGSGPVFGRQRRWMDINTSGGDNLVDCSYIEDNRWKQSGGDFLFCEPEQYKFGRILPEPWQAADVKVGLQVQKSGRTTGHTTGRVTGVGGTFYIGYDHGTGKFVRQIIIRGDAGLFSGPGDSGSLICDMNNRPVCLLFAGGNNDTIANPIEFVGSSLKLEFWQR